MTILFTNNASTSLASSITNSATSLTVATGTGSLFPTITGSNIFYLTLQNQSNTTPIEIVKVTARSGDTMTIVRAQDNTTASAFNAGDKVELRLPAIVLQDFPQLDVTNTFTVDQSISGLTVGKGGGALAASTAVGYQALNTNNGGNPNTAIGYQALKANTSGSESVAVGILALAANTTGNYNCALGDYSSLGNTTGSQNSSYGYGSLQSNTTGGNNTALGFNALYANTTASNNTAVGYQAGYSNTTSTDCTYVGYQAGYSGTTAMLGNTFIGSQAGRGATSNGNQNTAIGYYAGYSIGSGQYNVYIGGNNSTGGAGYNSTGSNNTFIGSSSGSSVTSGSNNSILGNYSGNQGGLDIRTSSNYIVLSDGQGNPWAYFGPSGVPNFTYSVGNYRTLINPTSGAAPYGLYVNYSGGTPNGTLNEFLYCADATALRAKIASNGGLYNYQSNNSNLSDIREKKNIELAGNYLDKLCQIPVKTFLFNDQTDTDLNLGVIAQDVQAVCPELVSESNWAKDGQEEKLRLSIYETDLKYAMLKAIQELNATVTDLQAKLKSAGIAGF